MVTRRRFFQLAAGAGTVLALSGKASIRKGGISFDVPSAEAYYQSVGLRKFIQPLRRVGPKQIPVAVPDGTRTWGATVADHYTIDINQFEDQLHPDLGKTTLRGYNPRTALGVKGVPDQKHLGGIIIAESGKPVQITFRNNLPEKHILPVDITIMGADQATNRTARCTSTAAWSPGSATAAPSPGGTRRGNKAQASCKTRCSIRERRRRRPSTTIR